MLLSGIAHYHREADLASPVDAEVRDRVANAKRLLKEMPGGKRALTREMLRKIADRVPSSLSGPRNRTMILLAFATGWRRSAITRLRYADIQLVPRGLEIWLRSSKTDQTGEGRIAGIPPGDFTSTCPICGAAVLAQLRGTWECPLFPRLVNDREVSRDALGGRSVAMHHALRKSLEAIGEEYRLFGAHSLRAGMITEAALHRASEAAIMQRTGHRSRATLRRYIRPATCFDFNPLPYAAFSARRNAARMKTPKRPVSSMPAGRGRLPSSCSRLWRRSLFS